MKEVHLLHQKKLVSTIFLALQGWFAVCGLANISIAYTTAHRTYAIATYCQLSRLRLRWALQSAC